MESIDLYEYLYEHFMCTHIECSVCKRINHKFEGVIIKDNVRFVSKDKLMCGNVFEKIQKEDYYYDSKIRRGVL